MKPNFFFIKKEKTVKKIIIRFWKLDIITDCRFFSHASNIYLCCCPPAKCFYYLRNSGRLRMGWFMMSTSRLLTFTILYTISYLVFRHYFTNTVHNLCTYAFITGVYIVNCAAKKESFVPFHTFSQLYSWS
jgi:hypothetical protein